MQINNKITCRERYELNEIAINDATLQKERPNEQLKLT